MFRDDTGLFTCSIINPSLPSELSEIFSNTYISEQAKGWYEDTAVEKAVITKPVFVPVFDTLLK
jgi:hypothetical protein